MVNVMMALCCLMRIFPQIQMKTPKLPPIMLGCAVVKPIIIIIYVYKYDNNMSLH